MRSPLFLLIKCRNARALPDEIGQKLAIVAALGCTPSRLASVLRSVNLLACDCMEITIERRGGDPLGVGMAEAERTYRQRMSKEEVLRLTAMLEYECRSIEIAGSGQRPGIE